MKTEWELTEESFNLFLSWLAPERAAAAQHHEKLRLRLIMLFNNRGCSVAEDLAGETFNHVIRRLPAIVETYVGAPAAYIQTAAIAFTWITSKSAGNDCPNNCRNHNADRRRNKRSFMPVWNAVSCT